jgi:hypothetical protein
MEFGQIQAGVVLEIPDDIDPDLFRSLFREKILNAEDLAPIVWAADEKRARPIPHAPMSPVDELAPSVSVYLEGTWKDDGPDPEAAPDLLAYVNHDLEFLRDYLSGFQLLESPRPMRVSGCDAVEFTIHFQWAHLDLAETVHMRQRMLYILQDPVIYSFIMLDHPELDPPLIHDFTGIIDSICIL